MKPAELLQKIISIPSFSGGENERADFVEKYLTNNGLTVQRINNNLLSLVECADKDAPTLMLNSHLDTVRPSKGYTFDPYNPPSDESAVYGLGSNDAGAAVVSMIETVLYFLRNGGIDFNLLLLLSAEEENSGPNGMSLAIKNAGRVDCAIIGEPTQMKAAIAERGLMVLDGAAQGVSGHAARNEGVNAIYKALDDINVLRNFKFGIISPLMGEVKLSVTQINAGTQHNVLPDKCTFVVDIRPTDCYTNIEILSLLQQAVKSNLTPRSLTNRCSSTPADHPLIDCAKIIGIPTFISPTTSDWMRIGDIPAVKMGPGNSARSHTPDEFITVSELDEGISGYINFIKNLKL